MVLIQQSHLHKGVYISRSSVYCGDVLLFLAPGSFHSDCLPLKRNLLLTNNSKPGYILY